MTSSARSQSLASSSLGGGNPGAGGWLWEQEAQKVAAALAVLFFHSAPVLVFVAQSNAAVFCPLRVPPLPPRLPGVL